MLKPKNSVSPLFLESNIRRRGEVGGSVKKIARRIIELERLYGIEHGGNHGNQYVLPKPNNSDLPKMTQKQLAEQMGMSVDTLQNYKMLIDMIPAFQSSLPQTSALSELLFLIMNLGSVFQIFVKLWN